MKKLKLGGFALLLGLLWFSCTGSTRADIFTETEFNDTRDSATPLPLNTTLEGTASHADDVDWYSFVLPEPTSAQVKVMVPGEYVRRQAVSFYMEDASGSLKLIAQEGGIGFSGFNSMNLGKGTYYVSIDCAAGEITEYGISVDTSSEFVDVEKEWNNTPAQATAIDFSTVMYANGEIIGYELGDEDWYSFQVDGNYQISMEFSFRSIASDIVHASICDANQKVLLSLDHTSTSRVQSSSILVGSGTYYLHVTAESANPDLKLYTADYDLSITAIKDGTQTTPPASDPGTSVPPADSQSGDHSGTTPAPSPVSLDKTTVQLAVGSSTQLKLSGASGTVAWKSSNPSVATVSSSGKVTGKKTGKATITAVSGGKSDTCTVTVVPKKQKITYSKSQQAGQVTLKWNRQTGVKGYQIRYSTDKSFKKNVKTVTVKKSSTYKKTISKLSKGKTYYFQVRSYGSYGNQRLYGSYSASAKVKVKGTASATGKLNKTKAQITVGGSTQLRLSGVSGTVTWKSSKPSIAAVSRGKVSGKRTGRAVITATCKGKKYTCTVTVVPKKQKITYAKNQKSGQITLKWNKASAAKGYQICYSTDKSFKKNVKKITVSNNRTIKKTITRLSKGSTYYIKVRSYGTYSGKKLYGAYSKAVKVTVSK